METRARMETKQKAIAYLQQHFRHSHEQTRHTQTSDI